jgi:Tfp pilus assembly protein PilX
MKTSHNNTGSVLLVIVLLVALLAATVVGHLQINAEEIQLMQNHIGGAQALATAEAGLNDALAQVRLDPTWHTGFVDKPFDGGSYTVVIDGSTIRSTGVISSGFAATMEAEVILASDGPPYLMGITRLRINP